LKAFDTLFNKRDYVAARASVTRPTCSRPHINRSRRSVQSSRFSGFGQAKNWIVADFVRVVDGLLVEHWDVVEDEASQAESKSGRPMFGDRFPL